MEVEFTPRGTGWRGRGRPPREVPEELLDILRRTYTSGEQANIPTAGYSTPDVSEVVGLLTRGAKDLGMRLRLQTDGHAIRFWAEDIPNG
jgi:hypothetical protein